jgi:predicted metal-dependent hydrolase|tara:strand:- start:894 stop:1322 length:429 start_codon:yes stop_codon:yes gene_type:complete
MIAFLILFVINLLILHKTQEPQRLIEIKEKYRILREHLGETNNEKFHMLTRCVPITGILRMKDGVGYNTNKGGEIAVCLDGEANEIFHVLIHELAHCTVKEYSHSDAFWNNYIELRDICVGLGIYEKIPNKTEFCGEHVQDK